MRSGVFQSASTFFAIMLLSIVVAAAQAHADRVVPVAAVTTGVNLRAAPVSDSAVLGVLRPGEQVAYIGSVPRWHEVRLADGRSGFVSKRWTLVVPDPVPLDNARPFAVHFLDVGTGDSAIIDVGDGEIIIDGGDSIVVLEAYARRAGIIDGPIELVVVTHGDTDHWNGLRRLLGFDGVADTPPSVLEYWDPGYDRDCNEPTNGGRLNYLQFVQDMQALVPTVGFRRPLAHHHAPATVSGTPERFTVASVSGVTFTLLHSEASPTEGSCSYKINNASIVLMIEVGGMRYLFTGDANGKERDEQSPGTPGHIEQKLLALERDHPGTLRADVLKVPHHGSETASTQAFIDAVSPRFVIISASTKHHLPKATVTQRYQDGQRVILRTDDNRENDRDHVVCAQFGDEFTCNYVDVLAE